MDNLSQRAKTYLVALYLKLYSKGGAIILPFLVVGQIEGGASTLAILPILVLYVIIIVMAAFDDEATVSQELKRIEANRTPSTKRDETILHALGFIAYNLLFLFPGGVSQQTVSPWGYLIGAVLFVAIYFLRPGSFKLK